MKKTSKKSTHQNVLPTKEAVRAELETVLDPELNISIVDLGLIYDIQYKGEMLHITMTLTSLGCPLFETIENDIEQALERIGLNPKQIKLNLTFEPPWSMERMSERAKAMLGI